MRILCDENIKYSIYHLLEQEEYTVERVGSALDTGDTDEAIADYCRENERVLLTSDEDFLTRTDHVGVLFLDEQRAPPRRVVTAIARIDRHIEADEMTGETIHVPDGWS